MPTIISEEKEKQIYNFFIQFKIIPVIATFFFILFSLLFVRNLSQQAVFAVQEYSLPYPGILPNHPFYPLKMLRDRALELFTREPLKKAELYLLFADKRIYMASMLAEQKKWELAETTASKAEKYLLKLKDTIDGSIKMGLSPDLGFVSRIKQAAAKHKRLILDLEKKAPKEMRPSFKQILKINEEFALWLKELK